MKTPSSLYCLLLLSFALAFLAARSHAQTVINSLPYTVSTPGDYVLGGNFFFNASSGNAITFAANNVTLDFAGHFIAGQGGGAGTQAYGLYAYNRANVTVQNGTVAGFRVGVYFDGSSGSGGNNTGNVVTNMRLPSNTTFGIYLAYPTTCHVENCQINKTGGTASSNTSAYGIYAYSGSVSIKNNQVSTTTPTGNGGGTGIYCQDSVRHFVRSNEVDTATYGILMDSGAGKRQDNLTANCSTAFSGGIDAGGNN